MIKSWTRRDAKVEDWYIEYAKEYVIEAMKKVIERWEEEDMETYNIVS